MGTKSASHWRWNGHFASECAVEHPITVSGATAVPYSVIDNDVLIQDLMRRLEYRHESWTPICALICRIYQLAVFTTLSSDANKKPNILETVHPIHSMFVSTQGFSGSADRMALFPVRSPSWNDGAVARNHCVSWAFLLTDPPV